MERIFILIFLIAVVPYAGLPGMYDLPIYLFLLSGLVFFSYLFFKKNIPSDENTKGEKPNTDHSENKSGE